MAEEYKQSVRQQYKKDFMFNNYPHFCDVYTNYIDIWLLDIKLNYSPSIYLPFYYEKFPLKITMWYENNDDMRVEKVWKIN